LPQAFDVHIYALGIASLAFMMVLVTKKQINCCGRSSNKFGLFNYNTTCHVQKNLLLRCPITLARVPPHHASTFILFLFLLLSIYHFFVFSVSFLLASFIFLLSCFN